MPFRIGSINQPHRGSPHFPREVVQDVRAQAIKGKLQFVKSLFTRQGHLVVDAWTPAEIAVVSGRVRRIFSVCPAIERIPETCLIYNNQKAFPDVHEPRCTLAAPSARILLATSTLPRPHVTSRHSRHLELFVAVTFCLDASFLHVRSPCCVTAILR